MVQPPQELGREVDRVAQPKQGPLGIESRHDDGAVHLVAGGKRHATGTILADRDPDYLRVRADLAARFADDRGEHFGQTPRSSLHETTVLASHRLVGRY